MNCVAISNNDIVYLHLHFDNKLTGCLGYSVIRHDAKSKKGVALPAMVGFPSDHDDAAQYGTMVAPKLHRPRLAFLHYPLDDPPTSFVRRQAEPALRPRSLQLGGESCAEPCDARRCIIGAQQRPATKKSARLRC